MDDYGSIDDHAIIEFYALDKHGGVPWDYRASYASARRLPLQLPLTLPPSTTTTTTTSTTATPAIDLLNTSNHVPDVGFDGYAQVFRHSVNGENVPVSLAWRSKKKS